MRGEERTKKVDRLSIRAHGVHKCVAGHDVCVCVVGVWHGYMICMWCGCMRVCVVV